MTWPARYVYVLAIEGVDTLLSNHDDAAAVTTAWSGTDWAVTTATLGLYVDLDQKQSGDPWEPFQSGGTLTATIADEQIGVLTHRTAGGAETELTASLDQDDTTISVKDTSAFSATGVLSIGTETIVYFGKTGTTFADCVRGICSPFGKGTGTQRYAHNHRVGVTGPFSPPIQPKVTQYPRTWIGRWVGLWVHAVNADGSLQTKADAELVFAGRLADVRDDADLLSTIFVADHVLTDLKEATVGRDMLSGEVADGIYIPAGIEFGFSDHNGSTKRTADDLVVVASGASGTNEMDAGFYTHSALLTKWGAWLAGELSASRAWGTYTFGIAPTQGTADSIRTKIYWRIPSSSTSVSFRLTLRQEIAVFLGFDGTEPADVPAGSIVGVGTTDASNAQHHFYRDNVPLRSWVTYGLSTGAMRVTNASGAFQDQLSTLPPSSGVLPTATGTWGLFLFNDAVLISAKVTDGLDGTLDLSNVRAVLDNQTGPFFHAPLSDFAKRLDDPTPTKIKQVFMFEMACGDFLNQLFYSGGTDAYNEADYDALPYGCGLGYPGELLGPAWETSVANMPGADKMIAPLIDKPMKISTLIGSDLVLRHVFPVWKSGGLRMGTWQTPTTSLALATLTEDNKAEPSGRDVNHRAPTLLSARWAKNIIKIEYNRDAVGGEYNGTINVEDRTAIDDLGDRGSPFTIEARNTYVSLAQTGAGIEDLVPNAFIPGARLFTKPLRTIKRSVDLTLWDLAPGDIVNVTDRFARDPTTGIRGVSGRPGAVVAHRSNPGGARPDKSVAPIVGEVELMFIETNRIYAYAPSALVASYAESSLILTCEAHAYSEASESVDAARFAAGDAIRIVEVDPADPASPLTWTRNITSVSGNDIVHDGVALASFDATKTYRITYDTYDAVQSAQHDKSFQADDADGLVQNTAQAYQFGLATSSIDATPSSHTDLPERYVELTYGDGNPYDVGSIVGFARLVSNLIDHKTAIQGPSLSNTVLSNTVNATGYRIVRMEPIYLTGAMLSNTIVRYLSVAPWLRSSDGTATSVRVSLCAVRPKDDSLDDADRGTPLSDATWNTSSTTWQQGARALLTINVKQTLRVVWLVIECAYKGETRGLAECTEQERMVF